MADYTQSIVQIFSNNIRFDWENPYKTYSEYVSTGTGFFIDTKGTILTCAHVIEDSIKTVITVPIEGKRKINATLMAVNFDKDIALLKTDYKNLSYLSLGDSDKVKQGDNVIAIGYPLGEDKLKFTSGIVSGIQGRYIQTDAPINSGNSGGPLIKDGRVIGINTSKITSADNIGYVTPINSFSLIAEEMYSVDGKQGDDQILIVPDLACTFMGTDKNILRYMKIPETYQGYMIKEIVETSPLYVAGLRSHDIITRFDGKNIDNYGEIQVDFSNQRVHIYDYMYRFKQNSVVKIKYWRKGADREIDTDVHFNIKYPYAIRRLRPIIDPPDFEIVFGLIIMPLCFNHLEMLKYLPISRSKKNKLLTYAQKENRLKPLLFISNILPGSYVMENELAQAGDIIDSVNNVKVNTIEEFKAAFKKDQDTIIIETASKNIIVFTLEDAIREEIFLSDRYRYPKSDLIKISDKYINILKTVKQLPELSDDE